MARKLFTVDEVFTIFGRGIVLLPGLSQEDYPVFKPGCLIELRLPNGTAERANIIAAEYPPSVIPIDGGPRPDTAGILLPTRFAVKDVPIGTEVWSVAEPNSNFSAGYQSQDAPP